MNRELAQTFAKGNSAIGGAAAVLILGITSLISLAFPTGALAAAPTPEWSLQTMSTSPSPRDGASMAYDPAIGKIVLFGGNVESGYSNETFTYNGSTWEEQTISTSPSAREGAAIAYDPATGKLVLFGGKTASGYSNETWTYNGSTWEKQSISGSPSGRIGASMAYDSATGTILLFGGYTESGFNNETFTYNGSTWERLSVSGSPSAREFAAMAYDPATGKMVLFGGETGSGFNNETYLLTSFVKSAPTLTTSASAAIRLGAKVKDEATLAGGEGPTGSIVFRLYGPEDEACTGTPAYTSSPVAVAGDGTYVSPEYTPPAPGTYRWIATYSGDANNSEVAGTCNAAGESVSVGRDSQTISFEALASHALSEASVALGASASSHLEVSFKSLTPATCSVSGATAHLIAAGTCTIEATQAGNADYEAAVPVQRSFQIVVATTTTTHTTTTLLCPKLAVTLASFKPKRPPLFAGKHRLLGLRLLVGLSAPATLKITPELRFHLRGKVRSRALRALSISVKRARKLRIALPRALGARLRFREAVRVSLQLSALPEGTGGCAAQTFELQLKTTVRSLLVPRR